MLYQKYCIQDENLENFEFLYITKFSFKKDFLSIIPMNYYNSTYRKEKDKFSVIQK